ncbi:MAG: nicotinate-nucleotide adenylyltransferase [Granulosicoccaceae bacterium]
MAQSHRIGVLGGTFDPVHYGHLRPALELSEALEFDDMKLVPNHRPVHRGQPQATTAQRLAMLGLAVAGTTLQVDDREARRDEPSFTVDTLQAMHNENPASRLVFCMGEDAFNGFASWHRWERILELANIVVMARPESQLSKWALQLIDQQAGVIERRPVTQLSISASDIRRRVFLGLSIRYLVPEPVKEYITHNNLYQSASSVTGQLKN